PRMAHHGRLDRSVHQGNPPSLSGHPDRWRARRYIHDFLSLCNVVPISVEQVGPAAMGGVSGSRIRQVSSSIVSGGLASFPMEVAQEPDRACAEDCAFHQQRDETHVQIRRQVGLPTGESDGREKGRTTPWINEAAEASGSADSNRILLSFKPTPIPRKAGG